MGSGSTISQCTIKSNQGVGSESYGIYAQFACLITETAVDSNSNTNKPSTSVQGVGIRVESESIVRDCTVSQNRGDGIRAASDCLILRNNVMRSGAGTDYDGAGIHTTGNNNRIEGNTVIFCDRGIDVDAAGNLIIRNSASNNSTNYAIAADNKVGPILAAPNSLAINGSTGGAGLGSTDPWANVSF